MVDSGSKNDAVYKRVESLLVQNMKRLDKMNIQNEIIQEQVHNDSNDDPAHEADGTSERHGQSFYQTELEPTLGLNETITGKGHTGCLVCVCNCYL